MEEMVVTKNGKVKGFFEDEVYKWYGIPFAQKPMGKLRFKQAQPVEDWDGVLEATQKPKKPLQPKFFIQDDTIGKSEDCLYVNIWSKGTKKKKPVLVWIYGGAFIVGESTLGMYDGTAFAKEDVVFVSINYRLGILGGYDLSMYSNEKIQFDNNIFISDQVEALKWIHENIEAFGGDPENVTIAGESAGAASVIYLMAVPQAKGLFQKVISESGMPNAVETKEVAKMTMDLLIKHLGLTEDTIHEIADMPQEKLEEAAIWLLTHWTYEYPGVYLPGPVYGDFIAMDPMEAIKQGKAEGIKLLIGTNKDEASIFVTKKDTCMCNSEEMIETMFKNNKISEEKRKEILSIYPNYPAKSALLEMAKDINFTVHSSLVADYQSKYEDTYMYRYEYSSFIPNLLKLGCFHSSEIPFALNTFDKYAWKMFFMFSSKKTLKCMTNTLHTAWLNFVKTGNPNEKGNEPWPKYDNRKKQVYVINKTCHIEDDPYKAAKEVWSDFPFYR